MATSPFACKFHSAWLLHTNFLWLDQGELDTIPSADLQFSVAHLRFPEYVGRSCGQFYGFNSESEFFYPCFTGFLLGYIISERP